MQRLNTIVIKRIWESCRKCCTLSVFDFDIAGHSFGKARSGTVSSLRRISASINGRKQKSRRLPAKIWAVSSREDWWYADGRFANKSQQNRHESQKNQISVRRTVKTHLLCQNPFAFWSHSIVDLLFRSLECILTPLCTTTEQWAAEMYSVPFCRF